MADDTLRMSAVVVDGFSGPLKTLQTMLGQVGNHPAGKSMQKDWAGVSASIQKVTSELRTGLSPVLSNIGVGSLGLGTALAGATLAMKNFAFSTRDMSMFGRQVGLSTAQLKEMKAVGERFGLGWDQAQGSLKTFAGNLDQVQRRWGEAYGKLRAMNLGDLAENLVSAPNMQAAIDKSLDALKGIQNPVRRREVAELLFGTDQWAVIARELTETQRKAIRSMVSEITPEMEKASSAFVENWFKMEKAVERFTTKAIGPLLPEVVQLMDLLGKPIGDELTASLTKIQGALSGFGGVIADFKSGNYLSGLRKLDGITDMGVGPRKAPNLLDLGMRKSMAEDKLKDAEGRGDTIGAFALRRELHDLTEEIRRLRAGGGATVQQQSYSGGMGGLIQTAGFGGGGMGLGGLFALGGRGGGGGGGFSGSSQGASVAPPAGSTQSGPIAPFSGGGGGRGGRGYANFDSKAPQIMSRLMADFGLTKQQAAGIVGNLGHESGAFNHHQEVGTSGGRGGVGWAQWTGPRRRAFESWAKENNLDPKSDEASYGFLTRGEPNEWNRALAAVRGQETTQGAMTAFERTYERAGVKAYGSRMGLANRALSLLDGDGRRAGGDVVIGDSIAQGLFGAGRGSGLLGGGQKGLGTQAILDRILKISPEWVNGKNVYLSSGASNSPGALGNVGKQIDYLKKAGALVTLLGAGPKMGGLNDQLREIATGSGAGFQELGPTGDGVHPRNYGALLGDLRRSTGDRMMGRAFGAGGIGAGAAASPKMEANGSVQITLQGGLEKMPARVTMDGLFKDVQVNRGKPMEKAE